MSPLDFSLMGDWIPLSAYREFDFSSSVGDKGTSSGIQDSDNGSKSASNVLSNCNQCDRSRDNIVMDEASNSGFSIEPKTGSRGGLVERMNFEGVKSSDYLKVQPSPTTEDFSIAHPNSKSVRNNRMENIAEEDGDFFVNKPANEINVHRNNGIDKIHDQGASFPGTCSIPCFDAVNKVIICQNHDKLNILDNGLSFAFRPLTESSSQLHLHTSNNELSSGFLAPFLRDINGVSFESESTHLHYSARPHSLHVENKRVKEQNNHNLVNVSNTSLSPLDEANEDDVVSQRVGGGEPCSAEDDGYNWRKYGQKRVKGSKHPRSYYKCTQTDCPVTKKVERSAEGYVVEIIYKGIHTHPAPRPNCSRSSSQFNDPAQAESEHGENLTWSNNMQENLEEAAHVSDSFLNDEDDDSLTHVDGPESKRRRVENYAAAETMTGAMRSTRETKVIVQTTSDVDILDDGYRWRKYGQKTVKGNPNPRSYYKCTSPDCNVRKHVERSSRDFKAVLTTYEGKHNHEVPAARNSATHGNNSVTQNPLSNQKAANVASHRMRSRPEPAPWASFSGLVGLPSLGLSQHPLHGLGMNHPAGLTGLGLHQGEGCSQMLRVNINNNHYPYLGHQPWTMSSSMGMTMIPKLEANTEPPVVNGGSSSSFDHPAVSSSRLPLGP